MQAIKFTIGAIIAFIVITVIAVAAGGKQKPLTTYQQCVVAAEQLSRNEAEKNRTIASLCDNAPREPGDK